MVTKCPNPKCNKKIIGKENLFCSKCVNDLSIFTRLKIYSEQLESEGKLKMEEK